MPVPSITRLAERPVARRHFLQTKVFHCARHALFGREQRLVLEHGAGLLVGEGARVQGRPRCAGSQRGSEVGTRAYAA